MSQADTPTLDTTHTIQLSNGDGTWSWHDGTEYTNESDVHELGQRMYDGTVPYRVVTITRSVGEAVSRDA